MATTTGQCLCGTVRHQVTGPLGEVRYCHCQMCRRATGHIRIRLGGIEAPDGVEITGHVWTESKAAWFEIRDDLPQYEQGQH